MKAIVTVIAVLFIMVSSDDHLGKWKMYKVYQDGKDVSLEHNPNHDRFITFKPNNTFESGGTPYGENTGTYLYNPEDGTLSIDSDAGPDDDSDWKIDLKNDTLILRGIGSEWAEAFEIVHIRA